MQVLYKAPYEINIPNAREECNNEIGLKDREARQNGLTYGQQVAADHDLLYVRPVNKPSKVVCKNRTLLEGLNTELTNLESRAEWLGDPVAIRAIEEKKRKEREAQNGT